MNNPGLTEKRLLVIAADDAWIADRIEHLKSAGFSVIHEAGAYSWSRHLIDSEPDFILLNTTQSKNNSFDICREIRSLYKGPLIILSDLEEEMNHIICLELGADDFVESSINPRLLTAKIKSLLRRSSYSRINSPIITLGELTVDKGRREVGFRGKNIVLTTIEFDMLRYLAENAGNIVSRNDIHLALHNSEYNGYDRSIDIYISRIRQKLGDNPAEPEYLKTVRGIGYLIAGNARI